MIKALIDILKLDPFMAQSDVIEIAKGKYKLSESFKEEYQQRIRFSKMKLKNIKDGRKKSN